MKSTTSRSRLVNRPMVSIDGYNGTVHRGPFQKCHGRPILMKGSDRSARLTF